MGYASLIEDIIKRFDAESISPVFFQRGKAPSQEAIAAQQRLNREKQATAIAVREFQKNQREAQKNQAKIKSIRNQIAEANGEVQKLKSKAAKAVQINNALNKNLEKHRVKYAHRAERFEPKHPPLSETLLASILTKIEAFKDLATLDRESRERFNTMKAYASSQRRLEAQERELSTLNLALESLRRETQTLLDFFENIDRDNRSLDDEGKTFEAWDIMTDWLQKSPTPVPKERPPSPPQTPFNPVVPTYAEGRKRK
jgi:hypothetical protein